MTATAFYCASSDLYFPGAVALVNSLRLAGHQEPIYLLDCGLSPAHRELLAREVIMVELPGDAPPTCARPQRRPQHPGRVDGHDRRRHDRHPPARRLIAGAAGGVVAFANDRDRFVAEWGELLGLGTIERRPLRLLGPRRARRRARRRAAGAVARPPAPASTFERSWFGARERKLPALRSSTRTC